MDIARLMASMRLAQNANANLETNTPQGLERASIPVNDESKPGGSYIHPRGFKKGSRLFVISYLVDAMGYPDGCYEAMTVKNGQFNEILNRAGTMDELVKGL